MPTRDDDDDDIPRKRRRPVDDEDEDDDRPRRKKGRSGKSKGGVSPLVWVAVAVGILIVLGGGAGLAWMFLGDKTASNDDSGIRKKGDGPPQAGWRTVSIPEGDLTLEAPGELAEVQRFTRPRAGGRIEHVQYGYTSKGGGGTPESIAVTLNTVIDVPKSEFGGKTHAESAAERGVRALHPEDGDTSSTMTLGGRRATVTVRHTPGRNEIWVYIGGEKFNYEIQLGGNGYSLTHPTVKRVLDSIKFK
jgi:hypothetical protein